ncbi:MAG: phosphonoacetate hydrolase [Limisphaerales bacterium]
MPDPASFTVNGRAYAPPDRPVAVICLDGSADEYLDAALARGRMPNLQRFAVQGWRGLARAAMPTFTNVNNASIVTGVPPRVHGIGGNYFYDRGSDEEVMMNSAKFLTAPTIFPAAQKAGRKVAVVTAKEKLRDIFASGLIGPAGGIAFSSEKAASARLETHGLADVEALVGRPQPQIYSGDASLYVLQAGAALLAAGRADFLYLSTTDYMQHTYAPDAPEAVEFYAGIDEALGRLDALGALIGITADHGMNAKQKPDGSPNVIYLESLLVRQFGPGFRVILPITDPYVVHHGALGSFAQVHLPSLQPVEPVREFIAAMPGITEVYEARATAQKLELPPERIGDLAVCAGRDVVIGRTPQHHDLKALHGGLRSHGGRYEEMVPFVFNRPLRPAHRARAGADVRNFDIFDFTCNGLAA